MMDEARNIGSRLELFVDDWLIDRMSGVRLRMHHPVSREIALDFNRPWEGETSWCPVVIKEGDGYRLWYRACREATENQRRTAYAESGDGIHWERPDLGIFDFQGSKKNNIVMEDPSGHNLSVFVDGNPTTPEAERYKGFAKSPLNVDGRSTIRGFSSPDGLHWRPADVDPLIVAPDDPWPWFDSPNIAFWDGVQRRYVAYLRGWVQGQDRVVSGHSGGVRTIRRSVSDDFRTWSVPDMIDMGDSPPEHLYTNAATP